jgi:predicted ATPase
MFNNLDLENFKNFQKASLALGPFSLLLGTNAAGKSNLRDAFRFLHGIGRGYSLADIIGQYSLGGGLQWEGIRGGIREISFRNAEKLSLDVTIPIRKRREMEYGIDLDLSEQRQGALLSGELFKVSGRHFPVFVAPSMPFEMSREIPATVYLHTRDAKEEKQFQRRQPILSQILDERKFMNADIGDDLRSLSSTFASMRFLDLDPDIMRQPSFPGQTELGDRGQNLSSVLLAICAEPNEEQVLLQWLRELTPMDASELDFQEYPDGKIIVELIEEDGQRTTAASASDGTLRFLGILAALLGPNPARFYFLEELENGIHPTRLHLLIQLIEQRVARGDVQVVATTHSPQLLGLVSKETLEHVSLVYRREGEASAQIRRLVDLPHAREILGEESLARLVRGCGGVR